MKPPRTPSLLHRQRAAMTNVGLTTGLSVAASAAIMAFTIAASAPAAQAQSNAAPKATRASSAAAWSLPDPDQLISRVFTRIVTQDRPNAIPIANYTQKLIGKSETLAALRQFTGRTVELRPAAFQPVAGWTEESRANYHPCIGETCESPTNSVWLAVTRIERGELSHEIHVWYTTSFASEGPTGAARESYSFCERWLRRNGEWKYDGFVRVDVGD